MAPMLMLVLLIGLVLVLSDAFSENQATKRYVNIVRTNPGSHPYSCLCPNDICNCVYLNNTYYLEAPFAALLVSPRPPPSHNWQPMSIYPMDPALGSIKASDQPLNTLHVMPHSFNDITASFKLFRNVDNEVGLPFPISHNKNGLEKWTADWDPSILYVVIHGWTSGDFDSPVRSLCGALLLQDQNVESALISVDWYNAATDTYRQSAANTIVVGAHVGYLMYRLVSTERIKASEIHLIGLDMGSHIATHAANFYTYHANIHNHLSGPIGTRIGRRTGLAPLGRYFEDMANINNAKYIDNVHTSTPAEGTTEPDVAILKRQFGFLRSHNDVPFSQIDFYPNGGSATHHCKRDDYGCSLNLAIALFKASLRNGYDRDLFLAYPYDKYQLSNPDTMGIDADTHVSTKGGGRVLTLSLDNVRKPRYYADSRIEGPKCSEGPKPVINSEAKSGCGERLVEEPRVFQGTNSSFNQHPWLVCIMTPVIGYWPADYDARKVIKNRGRIFRYRSEEDNASRRLAIPYRTTCTGSLIQDGWVVTAAHCFYYLKSLVPIYLVFGATNCDMPSEPRSNSVRRVIIEKRKFESQTLFYHGDYPDTQPSPGKINTADMVLIRLTKKVVISKDNNINTICYKAAAHYQYLDCSKVTYAGFGSKASGSPDPRLTWIRGNVIHPGSISHAFLDKPKYGLTIYQSYNTNPDVFGYANFEDHDKSIFDFGRAICGGDSGGPIMDYHLNNGRATLVGIHHAGNVDCATAKYKNSRRGFDNSYAGEDPNGNIWAITLSLGVRLSKYVAWIDEIIGKDYNEEPKDHLKHLSNELGTGPLFPIRDYKPTPVPPTENGKSLLD